MKILKIFAALVAVSILSIYLFGWFIGFDNYSKMRSNIGTNIVTATDPNNKVPAAINNFAADGTLCRPVWVTLKPRQEQTFEPQEGCKNLMWERENIPGKITLDFDGSNGVQSSTWTNDSEAPYYIGAYVHCVTLNNEGPQTVSLKFSYKN